MRLLPVRPSPRISESDSISRKMDSRRTTPRSWAVDQPLLPPELIVEVMVHLVRTLPGMEIKEERAKLSLVCRLWHYLVHATPNLWSFVCLHEDHLPSQYKQIAVMVDSWVERAGKLDLTLEVQQMYHSPFQSALLANALHKHTPRWTHVTLDHFPLDILVEGPFQTNPNGLQSTWRRLESLVLSNTPESKASAFPIGVTPADMPNLTSVILRGKIHLENIYLLPLKQLKHITIDGSSIEVIRLIIDECSNLDGLTISNVKLGSSLRRHPQTLKQLSHLRIDGSYSYITTKSLFSILHSIRFPQLQSLEVDLRGGGHVFPSAFDEDISTLIQKTVRASKCELRLTSLSISARNGLLGDVTSIGNLLLALPALRHLNLSDELPNLNFLSWMNRETHKGVPCLESIRLESFAFASMESHVGFEVFVKKRGYGSEEGERYATSPWSARIHVAELVTNGDECEDEDEDSGSDSESNDDLMLQVLDLHNR
jgi:F-box-like